MSTFVLVAVIGAGMIAGTAAFVWLAPYLLRWQLRRMDRIMGKIGL